MKTKNLISLFALLFLTTSIFAFEQKEIAVRSNSMEKDVLCTVITPEGYSAKH